MKMGSKIAFLCLFVIIVTPSLTHAISIPDLNIPQESSVLALVTITILVLDGNATPVQLHMIFFLEIPKEHSPPKAIHRVIKAKSIDVPPLTVDLNHYSF